ncbi:MAG: phage tail tube protein [Nitrospirota bacterium]
MGGVAGIEVKAAIKKAATWGTAVACGANNGILILPDSIRKDRPNNIDDSLGLYFPQDSDPGEIAVAGDLPAYLRYDGHDLLIALGAGSTGGAPVQQGATTAYQQTFPLADNNDGKFATLVLNKKINIEECTSSKIIGFTIKGEVGKPVQIIYHTIIDNKITDSVVNTLVTFANVTYFETKNRVMFNHGIFRMNAQDGGALGAGDKIWPNSFELKFMRKMSGVYGAGGTFNTIDEPMNDGLPEVSLKLQFPRYTSAAYFTDWEAGNAKKLDITFTGAMIANPYYRTVKIELPNLKFANVDAPTETGTIKHPVEFNCLGCAAAPTGMTTTKPFLITAINRQSADVLA